MVKENTRYISSFKEFLYNTSLGRIVMIGASSTGIFLGYNVVDHTLIKEPKESLKQKQVIGNDKPDIFIEREGVKYFSHVDGKEVSDLVMEE